VQQHEIEARAAGLKAFASWHAVDAVQAAREATGAQGYLTENRLSSMRRDVDIFTTYEGDNTVLSLLVAKNLLGVWRRRARNGGWRGVLHAGLSRTMARVTEASRLSLMRRAGDVTDPRWQRDALAWRQHHQIEALAFRIKKLIAGGTDPFDAFTQVQDHVMVAARSHVEWQASEAFFAAIEATEDPNAAAALKRLFALFNADRIRADLGWYQEHGRMKAGTAGAVRNAVRRLSAELAEGSLDLVNAFAIPDSVLAAPIAVPAHPETRKAA
jgi:acyl-CoA oxidase